MRLRTLRKRRRAPPPSVGNKSCRTMVQVGWRWDTILLYGSIMYLSKSLYLLRFGYFRRWSQSSRFNGYVPDFWSANSENKVMGSRECVTINVSILTIKVSLKKYPKFSYYRIRAEFNRLCNFINLLHYFQVQLETRNPNPSIKTSGPSNNHAWAENAKTAKPAIPTSPHFTNNFSLNNSFIIYFSHKFSKS